MPDGSGSDARAADDPLAEVVRTTVAGLAAVVGTAPAADTVTVATHLEADLGFDSLTVAELLVLLEGTLGRPLPESCLADVATVGDLIAAAAGVDARAAVDADPGAAVVASRPVRSAARGRRPEVTPARAPRHPTPYGIYAMAVFAVLAVIGWTLVAVLPGRERRWRVVQRLGRVLLSATGTRLQVTGEPPPRDGAYVVVANHPSFLDPLVLALLLPTHVRFTAVEGLVANPFVARFLRRVHVECVPTREDRRRAVAAAGVLTRQAAQGTPLVFFPEGRRSTSIGLERFRMGAFVVAAEAGVPLVPIAIRGTRTILPVGARWPRRAAVEVVVGAPIMPQGPGFEQALALRRSARAAILRHCDEPDLDHVTR